jgi:HTH-type transcriptional regulator, sugar sensing transcriptional regulator
MQHNPSMLAQAPSDPVSTLSLLGLTRYQSEVWLELTRGFPATAYELSKRCGLPRANVYAAVRRLVELGAAVESGASPATYVPADPQSFVEQHSAAARDRLHSLARELGARVQRSGRGALRVVRGAAECQAQLEVEFGEARHYLWIKGRSSEVRRHLAALQAASARGVALKLIVFGPTAALQRKLPNAQVFAHEGSGQRLSGASDALFTVARDGVAVTAVAYAGDPQATFARDHLLVYVIHSYLLHEVFLAELGLGKAGRAVRDALVRLRQQHRPAGMERSIVGA